MSKESVLKAAQAIPAIKILSPQICKLKKEEDEETWISGEELYTEGSSDEENSQCKSSTTSVSKETSLSLVTRSHRSKEKADKKLSRATESRSASAEDVSDKSLQLTSQNDEEEEEDEDEYAADDEISWKANREELHLADEMFVLQEYPKICESMDNIFGDLIDKLNHLESVENENFPQQKESFENSLKSSTAFFDAAINKLQSEIESVKQKTRQVQFSNRLRLNEIAKEGPKSKKLSENDKRFIELFDQNELSDFKDLSSEYSKFSSGSESLQLSEITEDNVQLFDESTTFEEGISNGNSMPTASDN